MRFCAHGNSIGIAATILLYISAADRIQLNGRCRGSGCWDTGERGVVMRRSPQDSTSIPTSATEPTVTATTSLIGVATSNSTNATTNNSDFVWSAIGDSWTSGVAYSWSTIYELSDLTFCYRTNQAWGPLMKDDHTWTIENQMFKFAACGGTLMKDIRGQMGDTANSLMMMGTFGGNDASFGDIARACIYQPVPPGGWGLPYDEDPNGEGYCKINLAKSRAYINNVKAGLRYNFNNTINDIFEFKQRNDQLVPRFDLYVVAYVQFFNATTEPCNNWTFARWFSAQYPKLVIPLRAEMNELVDMFNNVQEDVLTHYPLDQSNDYYVHHINVSDEFAGHRFCEEKHNETDQWVSSDVWIWNLQYNDGDTGGTDKPPDAPNATAIPVMSLDTQNITWVDDLFLDSSLLPPNDSVVGGPSQSGFGWTSRPFHPKPLGYERMKEFFIQRLKDDEIPGVIAVNQTLPPANATALSSSSTTSSQSSSPSPTTTPAVTSTTSTSVAATTSSSDLNVCINCPNPNASDGGCPPDHPTVYALENAGIKTCSCCPNKCDVDCQ